MSAYLQNKFIFRPLRFSDVPLMHEWFNLPHVQKFYSLRQWTEQQVLEKLEPYITGVKPVLGFIALMDEKPIGYVQQCRIIDYPWPNQNLPEEIINSAAGVDLFIGDETLIGKGIGGQVLKAFIEHIIWPEFQYCIVDPDTKNIAAIRCYEKLNFRDHAVIGTKDALDQPTTLRLMILKH
jgi:RimJ/RimL family protein N-acetyltransferase